MFPSGGDGIHLIVDEQGSFQPANFQRATSSIKPKPKVKVKGGGKGGGGKQAQRSHRTPVLSQRSHL